MPEPLLSHVIVTENSWRDRVMPAEDLKKTADRVFGPERVTCIPELPDAIQEAVNMVDADDELFSAWSWRARLWQLHNRR